MDKEKLVLSIVKEYLYRGLTEEELKQAGLDGLKIAEENLAKKSSNMLLFIIIGIIVQLTQYLMDISYTTSTIHFKQLA